MPTRYKTPEAQAELSRHHSALMQKYVDADQGRLEACKSASLEIYREWMQVDVGAAGGGFHSEQMGAEVVA